MVNLFVYGTLMFTEVVKALTKKEFVVNDAVLRGYNRYQANGPNGADPYPAIIKETGAVVKGKVLFDVDVKSLKIIDFFESFEDTKYQKIKVLVEACKEKIQAFVYVWTDENRKYLTVPWDPEKFRILELEDFLKTIHEVLEAYKATC